MYLQFPPVLTEEELSLKAKYALLNAKKKTLHDLKTCKSQTERAPQAFKCSTETNAARELAKKLLASGAITKKPAEQSFKRPLGWERKLNNIEKSIPSSYQPFSAVQNGEEPVTKRTRTQNLYTNFVLATDSDDKVKNLVPKQQVKGNTILVYGIGLSEDFLKKHFSVFGNIVKISVEEDEKKGTITFEEPESADNAVYQMDGALVASIELKVSMEKKQRNRQKNAANFSTMWLSGKTGYKGKKFPQTEDNRDLKVCQNDVFE